MKMKKTCATVLRRQENSDTKNYEFYSCRKLKDKIKRD